MGGGQPREGASRGALNSCGFEKGRLQEALGRAFTTAGSEWLAQNSCSGLLQHGPSQLSTFVQLVYSTLLLSEPFLLPFQALKPPSNFEVPLNGFRHSPARPINTHLSDILKTASVRSAPLSSDWLFDSRLGSIGRSGVREG